LHAQIRPPGGGNAWSHSHVAAQFDGTLINRRKLYRAELRTIVARNHLVRLRADYEVDPVSRAEASRALRRAQVLMADVQAQVEVTERSRAAPPSSAPRCRPPSMS